MHKEIIVLVLVGIGAAIGYSIYQSEKIKKNKIISAQVKQKEASTQQVETKPLTPFFSQVPDTFNFIKCENEDFTDSGAALARSRQ